MSKDLTMLVRNLVLTSLLAICFGGTAAASEADAWKALGEGAIVLFRHANAPGGGDPPNMQIGNCASQRNLDAVGRAQAQRIGQAFRTRAINVSGVLASQWCRTLETGRLAFGTRVTEEPVFNSFFDDRGKGPDQTRAALALLSGKGPEGALVVITHQVNITSLTGIFPASGEGIVVRISDGQAKVIGNVKP